MTNLREGEGKTSFDNFWNADVIQCETSYNISARLVLQSRLQLLRQVPKLICTDVTDPSSSETTKF